MVSEVKKKNYVVKYSCKFFIDVAISAPYEKQTGVVYIYLGNNEGITRKFSQRIQPEDFHPKVTIRGFGISLSKGIDVDHNSYNGLGFT